MVAAGAQHTCAVVTNGTLRCWGGGAVTRSQAAVPRDLGPVAAVSSGPYTTCVVTASTRALRCWGYNDNFDPVDATPDGPAAAVAAGAGYACAVMADGTLQCFSVSSGVVYDAPPSDLGLSVSVVVSTYHTCALATSGAVRCWDQLERIHNIVPSGLGRVIALGGGMDHTCALTAAGTVTCWGASMYNETSVPADLGPVVALATGGTAVAHTCVIVSDGGCTHARAN